jgi:UDP-glucuronate 4-epimerase
MRILITGTAGFIGSALALKLLARGDEVIGVDNVNDYYDVSLKLARLERVKAHSGFTEVRGDIENRELMAETFRKYQPQRVVNLAAQAGVRYSLENPYAYIDTNILGFMNVLENCRYNKVEHLVYASSSSVYGSHTNMPFSIHEPVDHPVSLYAATKKSNELMAHTYSHLFNIPTTGLRFFTVYGPWGRPDMALFMFARNILAGKPIDVFNYGKHKRDFTFIDDIVEGVIRTLDNVATANPDWQSDSPDPATSAAPFRLYNIGNNQPVDLEHYIHVLESCLGKTAEKNLLPLQPGDVPDTYADVSDLIRDVDYKPDTSVEEGIARFVDWYKEYYKV